MKLWRVLVRREVSIEVYDWSHPAVGTVEYVNRMADPDLYQRLFREMQAGPWFDWDAQYFAELPTPVIRITQPGFAHHYFDFASFPFVSARLRAALALDDDAVTWREVDLSQSTPEVQAQDYRMALFRALGNPYDPERMPGAVQDVRGTDGVVRREWVLAEEEEDEWIPSYFRTDFVPPAPIFRTLGELSIMATDELAERVARAGITDMSFVLNDVDRDRP